ncbi:MAG: ABC transporter permease [Lachnospiraceae bacterium]|nr:ABC transporter permease [Lachnospiraceae bacterium]
MDNSKKEKIKSFFTGPVIVSAVVLLLIILASVFAGIIAKYDPNEVDISNILSGPTMQHFLGTDKAGRDIFSRILFGGRMTLLSALGVILISVIIGVPVGIFSGYYGGWTDKMLMRISDIILAFPSLLLAFVFVSAFGRGIINAVVALGIVYVPMLAKLTRSLVMVEKNKVYVEASKSIGYSDLNIMFKQILPNCVSTLLVQLTLDIGYAILDLASMSFLGLGVQPPTSDWGAMLDEGRIVITISPLASLAPGMMIILTVVALNIFGDGVRAYLDPQQRKLPSLKKFKKLVGEEM